jgi:ubiquinone/menaquinone biosynthesis C-methylase UbiE
MTNVSGEPDRSPSPQNIYDDPDFYAGYEHLRRTGTGLNEVLEQPALWSLLPDSLDGLRVLDLGCGFGDFARKARQRRARSVLAIDVSENMLARAAELTKDPGIEYRHQSIEQINPDEEPFDLVVSSLALHYVADYRTAVERVACLLAPGGRFAFSVEHPICTALPEQQWVRDTNGKALYWPIDNYREEGPRQTHWFVDGVVKYHRTVETYVGELLRAGLTLTALREPAPVGGTAGTSEPNLDRHRRRPPFLLLTAAR